MLLREADLPALRHDNKGKRIVLAVGAFDLFHAGHMDYLRWARWVGGAGSLVVALVRTDERVAGQKERGRPIIQEDERAYIVDNSRPVDFTFLGTETALHLKRSMVAASLLKPDVLAMGDGWRSEEEQWRSFMPKLEIATAPFPHRQSTTRIIHRIRSL